MPIDEPALGEGSGKAQGFPMLPITAGKAVGRECDCLLHWLFCALNIFVETDMK